MNIHIQELLEFDKIKEWLKRKATTRRGKEFIAALSPEFDICKVRQKLDEVREAVLLLNARSCIPEYQERELTTILREVREGQVLSPGKLLELADFLRTVSHIRNSYTPKFVNLYRLTRLLNPLTHERREIEDKITETGELKSPSLKSLRKGLFSLREATKAKLAEIIHREWTSIRESLITIRENRYVIPIKKGKRIDGIVHSVSGSLETLFVEPMSILSYNNEIIKLEDDIKREEKRVLRKLTSSLKTRMEVLDRDVEIIGKYDLIYAISKLAREIKASIPAIRERPPLIIRDGRHPLLVLKGAEVVPLNLKLGTSYNTLLITGPNMGGKTVALKTCGLLSLMALSGIPIPAGPDTEIPLFKEIYADMGDESSIEDGISTFSSHLKNLMEMEKNAGDGTLILIDEIMRGTDPEEGNCLASAFLEDFTAKNALVIATTHSSALKLFVHKMDKMENGGMEFKSGFPTYKLNIGLPGSSYGIETAENMRVPQKIVKRAREFMTRDVFNVDILLRELEERRVKLKEREGKISEREEEVRKTLKAMRIREMELMKKQENMKMEARRVVEDGRRFIENAVKEIREKKGEKDVIKRVKREIRKRLEESTPVVKGGLSFKVGDYVIIRGSGIEGRVIKITDKRAVLSVDGVQFTVPKSSLSKGIQKEKREEPIVKFTRDIDIDYEINLRRLEREEALEKLRRYIDNAELVGLKNFKVIHGVGKGILKRAVWEELKNDERIDSFSLGELYEGGDGVTIVTMRE